MLPPLSLLLAACAPWQAAPEPAFERLPDGAPWPAPAEARLPGDVRYAVEGGRLVRLRGGVRETLGCTLEGGPGAVRALAHHPAGTTFVAAERGLFRVSPEVDHLDPVEFAGGEPPGAPVGLHYDGDGRLWMATEQGFGCLDTLQFFGRSIGPGDGLPPGPFLDLAAEPDGALLLRAAGGVYRYRPGRGPPPAARVPAVDGRPRGDSGEAVEVAPDGAFELALEGEALGGASFRYRLRRHHLWRPLDAPLGRVAHLEPGRHEVLVAAYDRDLVRSEPVSLAVRVPYPRQFDERLLVPAAAGAALGVLVLFVLRARRRVRAGAPARAEYARGVVGAGLFTVLGLQLLTALVPHARSWPFVGFAMYTEKYRAGDCTYKQTLYAIRRDGTRYEFRPHDAGYGQYVFKRALAPLVHGDDAARQAFLDEFNTRNVPVRGFLIQDERHRLTPGGPVPVAATVMCLYPEGALDDAP